MIIEETPGLGKIEVARQLYKTTFAQNRTYDDPSTEDPFFPWKNSPYTFKGTLAQDHITPLTVRNHEPVIGDPTYSGGIAIPRIIEWIVDGKLYALNLILGTAVESTFSNELHPVLKVPTTIQRPRTLNDEEFRTVMAQLQTNPAIKRTGVLDEIENRRQWESK